MLNNINNKLSQYMRTTTLLLQIALGVVITVATQTVKAQTGQEKMTMKQCVEYSLTHHPSVLVYNNEVKIANQRATEALAGYLPQVNGSVALDDNILRQTTVIPAGALGPNDTKVKFGNQYNTTASVQADQVIYDQSLIIGIQANEPNKQLAQLNKEQNEEVLIYNTMQAYYQVLVYTEQEKLLAENEKKFADIVAIQKVQYESGVIKKVDYDRVRVNLNNVTAQRKLAQMNLQLATNRLKNAMGMTLESAIAVSDSIDYKQGETFNYEVNVNTNNLTSYKIQYQNTLLQNLDVRRKKAAYLPTLSGYARYGAQAFGNNYSSSLNHWYDYSAVGLKLNVPIFSGMKKSSQLKQSQYSLVNARENLKITERNIQLQAQNSNTQLLGSYNNLVSNKENLDLAKDVFDNTSLQYKNGASQLSDLLNADYSYKEAQTNYINSLLNYMIAKIDLEKSKGTLKQYINQL
jgi:outer membrane protein